MLLIPCAIYIFRNTAKRFTRRPLLFSCLQTSFFIQLKMRAKYIQGIYGELAGKLDQKLMDLENLLANTVGIGEHGNISSEIKKQLEEVDRLKSLKETMEELFTGNNPAAPVDEDAPDGPE